MAKEVRQVVFEFLGDAGDLAKETDAAARNLGKADGAAKKTSSTLMTKLKPAAAAAGAAAAAMAAKWAIDGIAMAETAEVAAASFEKTFGPAADDLTASLEDQRLALGLSEQAFQKQATSIGAAAISMGATADSAAQMTDQILTVAADVAAFNGELANAPEVVDAINGALAGSYETLDKYGISITSAMVEQKALADTGKQAASELTELEKRTATVALVTEQAALATGSLDEQMDSAAVKSNQFAARMADVQTQVGTALLPLKELALEVLLALVPILEALNPLIKLFGALVGGLVKLITPVINLVARLTQGFADLINTAAKAMSAINPFKGFRMPSFHSGGVVPGPTGSSQMAMLQGGERVVPAGAGSRMAGGGGGSGTTVNVTVQAGLSNPQETARAVVDLLEDYTRINGPVDIAVRS
jgi:hypothetical protein